MGPFLSRSIAAFAVIVGCVTIAPAIAYADEATAETLFQEGLAAMRRNDYAVACEAFAASNKADPSPGTQINLALCYEKQKKWASAWAWYRSAVGLAQQRGQKEREQLAEEAANRIKSQLHYIVVSVKEPAPGLVVKRDGVEVVTMVAGKQVPLPIDPGEHVIEVSAPGKKPWSKTIQIADDANTDQIDVPKLEDAPVEEKNGGSAPGVDAPRTAIVANDGSNQRTIGVLVAGAGLLSGIAGVGVFALAKSQESERDELYRRAPDERLPLNAAKLNEAARSHHEAAENDVLIARLLGAGAVVLVGVGAAIYFNAPKPHKATKTSLVPLLGPRLAGVGFGGAF
jgi:tetratricopeptide (TPR) repeat protein